MAGKELRDHFHVFEEFCNVGEPEFCNDPRLYDIRKPRNNTVQSAYISALRAGRRFAEKYWGGGESRK